MDKKSLREGTNINLPSVVTLYPKEIVDSVSLWKGLRF